MTCNDVTESIESDRRSEATKNSCLTRWRLPPTPSSLWSATPIPRFLSHRQSWIVVESGARFTIGLFLSMLLRGNPDDIIDRVSFDLGPSFSPRTFTCSTPVPKRGNIWSFQTRQQTYGPVTASIQIRGVGGSVLECSHKIQFTTNAHSPVRTFRETRNPRPLKMLKMPNDACFGIELELTSAVHVPPETVAQNLESTTIPFQVGE